MPEILFVIAVIVGLTVMVIIVNNKYRKDVGEATEKFSKEDLNRIRMAKIEQHPNKANKYITEGIILDVRNEKDVKKVDVMVFNNFVGEYLITKNVVYSKDAKVGDFVTTVHKKDKDLGLGKVKEIM